MKFELVGYYPVTEKNYQQNSKDFLGTVHLYIVDIGLDIRGIRVTKSGNKIFFNMPHERGVDPDTGERVRFPIIRWTEDNNQKEMIAFLQEHVKKQAMEVAANRKWHTESQDRPTVAKKAGGKPKVAVDMEKRLGVKESGLIRKSFMVSSVGYE